MPTPQDAPDTRHLLASVPPKWRVVIALLIVAAPIIVAIVANGGININFQSGDGDGNARPIVGPGGQYQEGPGKELVSKITATEASRERDEQERRRVERERQLREQEREAHETAERNVRGLLSRRDDQRQLAGERYESHIQDLANVPATALRDDFEASRRAITMLDNPQVHEWLKTDAVQQLTGWQEVMLDVRTAYSPINVEVHMPNAVTDVNARWDAARGILDIAITKEDIDPSLAILYLDRTWSAIEAELTLIRGAIAHERDNSRQEADREFEAHIQLLSELEREFLAGMASYSPVKGAASQASPR
jgi:hypothetical protein